MPTKHISFKNTSINHSLSISQKVLFFRKNQQIKGMFQQLNCFDFLSLEIYALRVNFITTYVSSQISFCALIFFNLKKSYIYSLLLNLNNKTKRSDRSNKRWINNFNVSNQSQLEINFKKSWTSRITIENIKHS